MKRTKQFIKFLFQKDADSVCVGDFVKYKDDRNCLHCGSGIYDYAIVVSVEPFVLVSQETDMRWSCVEKKDFKVIGKANWLTLFKCMRRL